MPMFTAYEQKENYERTNQIGRFPTEHSRVATKL